MTKKEKRLAKIKANPKQVRFKDLASTLRDAGFEMRQSKRGTSHHVFYHDALDRVVVLVTHGKNDILPNYQVRQALVALDIVEESAARRRAEGEMKNGA